MNQFIILKHKRRMENRNRQYGYQNMTVSKELHAALKELSNKTGRTMMDLMNLALENFLREVKVKD